MRYIVSILLSFILYTNLFSQSEGYFQLRGRVNYRGSAVEGASMQIYFNSHLIKKYTTKSLGKFNLEFELNKSFVLKVVHENTSRSIIINTQVPKSKKNTALDLYEVINLLPNEENNQTNKLLCSYCLKNNKFVVLDAPKNFTTLNPKSKEHIVTQLQNEIVYLKKLLENNKKLTEQINNAHIGLEDSVKFLNEKLSKETIIVDNEDTAYISKLIKEQKKGFSLDKFEQYEFYDSTWKKDKDIVRKKQELKLIEQTEGDSLQKDIKIKEKKIEIIEKMLELANQSQNDADYSSMNNTEKLEFNRKIKEISSLEQDLKNTRNELITAKQTIEIKNLQIRNRTLILKTLIAGIVVVVAMLIMIYINYKRKKRLNDKLELQNQELEKLSIVASETTNAIIITNNKGEIDWVNKAYHKIFDFKKLSELEQNIFGMGYDEHVHEKLKSTLENGIPCTYITQTINNSGKRIWVQASVTPILDKSGNVLKLVIIYANITDIKEAQQKIEQQNKQIMDSINYAKRIQDATLPSQKLFKSYFPNSFIYFQPRDVVSGDFYWLSIQDDKFFVAAVDCTGHGVPGAFMSLIGNSLLNNIVNERKIYDPAEILIELNKGVIKSLNQSNTVGEAIDSTDGMDLTICRFDKGKEEIKIALANHRAFIIDDNQNITEIHGDDFSIGEKMIKLNDIHFTTHTTNFKKGYTIYLFSDGFHDQLGGPKYKKLLTKQFKKILLKYNSTDLSEFPDKLERSLKIWKGKYKQTDDILVMGIRL